MRSAIQASQRESFPHDFTARIQLTSVLLASRDSGSFRYFMNQRIARQDRIAGLSLLIPIEAGRNGLGREKQTFRCLSFLLTNLVAE